MASVLLEAKNKGLISPPSWLPNNVMFEGITGSVAYAVSSDTSDMDVVGFCIPPKDVIFPHLRGEISGFGTPGERFNDFTQHHVIDKSKNKEYDFTIYSIVQFFELCRQNNPNMVDVLFLPRRCVLHSTRVYEMVREKRKSFLHKGAWHRFKGYSYSQMSKIKNKTNSSNPKRAELIAKFGYDTKFAYHIVRLMNEVEQILTEHDLDLERSKEQLKSIRRGEWTLDEIEMYAKNKETLLEKAYHESKLPHSADENEIKTLLINCLEEHYGSLSDMIAKPNNQQAILNELQQLVDKYR